MVGEMTRDTTAATDVDEPFVRDLRNTRRGLLVDKGITVFCWLALAGLLLLFRDYLSDPQILSHPTNV